MRYFHQRADEIRDYVRARGLVVVKCHYAQEGSALPVGAISIAEILKRSETLWGGSLIYYLSISGAFDDAHLSLADAVVSAESVPAGDRFLIVAHQDGGIVSVSGLLLPFQQSAEAAEWWRPYRYADSD